MDFFEEVRRLTITALFSDDVLFEQLVLKGGNAISLVHGLGLRSSFDLDFSLAGDFADANEAEARAHEALRKRFESAGYRVFDFGFRAKPKLHGVDERPWWGGYEIDFKILPTAEYERLSAKPDKRSMQALATGPNQQRKIRVDISKNEYVEGRVEQELDHFTIRVYTPMMVAAEKLRAICQQMPEYTLRGGQSARARDFYDITLAIKKGGVRLDDEEGRRLLREMFDAKRVPLSLLGRLESQREFHRPDWPNVVSSVAGQLESFDTYFDFVLEEIQTLEPLWNV